MMLTCCNALVLLMTVLTVVSRSGAPGLYLTVRLTLELGSRLLCV